MQIRPELIKDLKRDEGLRLKAYPDPLTKGEPYTIGYGHTGGIKPSDVWDLGKCESVLMDDALKHARELEKALPWVLNLSPVRQDVLINMTFNMGLHGVLGFHNTLAHVHAGNYKNAADGMRASAWAKQVGARAERLAKMMETGAR